ncbi:Mu transposase C-terminal domain-containing protein [Arthrobacter sp. VKM Ac-2550]|nr:Mu transposase C-terminal domain-containing protein [Arthrobacter sp. VKM Ac-2550]
MARWSVLSPHEHEGVPLTRAAAEAGVSTRTAERWLSAYRRHGLAGLAPTPRSDRDRRRIRPELVTVIEALYLKRPAPSVATVHRKVQEIAAGKGWTAPGYTTVRSIVRALGDPLVTLAQQGTKAYQQAYDLLYRRESQRSNGIWQADHTELDILVIDPEGKPARPWLSVILDDHSRAVPGYALNLCDPSALNTALALHQAIWTKTDPAWHVCGIPEVLYVDHGSDFTSRHLEQVCADLHIQLIHSTAGKPRGRGKIERLFRSVNQLFLPGLPGHLVHGVQTSVPKLTLGELDGLLHAFIVGDYNQRRHSETGEPPQQRWDAGGFLPQLPERIEDLDLLLLTVPAPRVVHRDGIRFQNLRYLDVNLAAFVGEPVLIRYDPRDLGQIRVFHNGTFLCTAICQDIADATISLKDLRTARDRHRRQLREEITARHRLVDELLAVHQAATPAPRPARKLKRYRND